MQLAKLVHSEFDIQVWFHITLQIAEGLEYIHQKNIIHRDLKTDNITMYEQNKNIPDFGKSDYGNATKKYNHRHIAPDLVDGIENPKV